MDDLRFKPLHACKSFMRTIWHRHVYVKNFRVEKIIGKKIWGEKKNLGVEKKLEVKRIFWEKIGVKNLEGKSLGADFEAKFNLNIEAEIQPQTWCWKQGSDSTPSWQVPAHILSTSVVQKNQTSGSIMLKQVRQFSTCMGIDPSRPLHTYLVYNI